MQAHAKRQRVFFQDHRETAAVFVGGATGTLLRAALSTWLPTGVGEWPWATLGVNIIGAFMVSFFTTRLLERLPLSSFRRPLLGTGLCGGLTTFSTMQLETLRMMEAHCFHLACAYIVVSAGGGLLAVRIASAAVRRVRIGRRA
nr:fluoride efflux transporter CrcB [Mycobacterium malmoense]